MKKLGRVLSEQKVAIPPEGPGPACPFLPSFTTAQTDARCQPYTGHTSPAAAVQNGFRNEKPRPAPHPQAKPAPAPLPPHGRRQRRACGGAPGGIPSPRFLCPPGNAAPTAAGAPPWAHTRHGGRGEARRARAPPAGSPPLPNPGRGERGGSRSPPGPAGTRHLLTRMIWSRMGRMSWKLCWLTRL